MELILKTNNGKLIQGDNLEVMEKLKDNTFDSGISDFPYNLSFMGKSWDTTENFYEWNKKRATQLYRIIKPGGYVCIFGHPKTNHRMKCAFEDVGFNIVEEIEWIYGTGFPKNQDIAKMYDKLARGCPQGKADPKSKMHGKWSSGCTEDNEDGRSYGAGASQWGDIDKNDKYIPSSEQAKKWDGWKTSGLKPAHESITIFQKPLEGTYIQNIEKHNCGAMNIDACRIPTSQEDKDIINAKSSKNPTTNYSDSEDKIYGAYAEDKSMPANEIGRFPANIILDEYISEELDNQSGIRTSGIMKAGTHRKNTNYAQCPVKLPNTIKNDTYGDTGGASRYFLKIEEEDFVPFLYCPKATKKEKGEGNTHVTVKPKQLIKWLIKLVTPKDGKTIDVTAGSGTHGLSCEELNRDEEYNLKWINIELLNTEKEPYCEIAKNRIQHIVSQ